jgi:hypothetical protein
MSDREQLIDQGHVYCALRRADVDIEECFRCRNLRDVRFDRRLPTVVCRIDRVLERPIGIE